MIASRATERDGLQVLALAASANLCDDFTSSKHTTPDRRDRFHVDIDGLAAALQRDHALFNRYATCTWIVPWSTLMTLDDDVLLHVASFIKNIGCYAPYVQFRSTCKHLQALLPMLFDHICDQLWFWRPMLCDQLRGGPWFWRGLGTGEGKSNLFRVLQCYLHGHDRTETQIRGRVGRMSTTTSSCRIIHVPRPHVPRPYEEQRAHRQRHLHKALFGKEPLARRSRRWGR